ncbi:hypothetical protein D9M71_386100 [compost metagenome]
MGQRRGQLLRTGRRLHRLRAGGRPRPPGGAGDQPAGYLRAAGCAPPGESRATASAHPASRDIPARCREVGPPAGAARVHRGCLPAVADAGGPALSRPECRAGRRLRQPAGLRPRRSRPAAPARRLGTPDRPPCHPAHRLRLGRAGGAAATGLPPTAAGLGRTGLARARQRRAAGLRRCPAQCAVPARLPAAAARGPAAPRRAQVPAGLDLAPPAAGRLEQFAADRGMAGALCR